MQLLGQGAFQALQARLGPLLLLLLIMLLMLVHGILCWWRVLRLLGCLLDGLGTRRHLGARPYV